MLENWWAVGVGISAVVSSLVLWVLWRVLNWVWVRPKKLEKCLREQGFAGNPYRILYGDLNERSALLEEANSKPMTFSHHISSRVFPSMCKTIQTYGKRSYMWLGPYPRVHIMDPEQLRATFSLIHDIQKPDFNPFIKLLLNGIIALEGDKWAKHRKIVNPAYHLDKLKDMVPALLESCNEIVSEWERIIMSKEGCECELDVMPYLHVLTCDAISRTVFGSSYREGQKIFQLLKQLIELVTKVASGIYIPGWRFVPTKSNRRMKEIHREIKGLIMGIIKKRQEAVKEGDEVVQNDLLGILLESNAKEIESAELGKNYKNKDGVGMSIDDVVEECKIFYIGGQETSALLLTWTMILLSFHTEWQDRARAEVLEVFGNDKPHFDGLSRLKVVNMILHEVLRLYPPASMLTRMVKKETKIGNLSLPSGVMLIAPVVLIHRDAEIWGEDANEFKPERFSNGVSKASKLQPAFFPFGWGPRLCLGQNFALIETKIAISLILQRFSFRLSPSYTHAPTVVMTTQPQHGAHVILRKL